MGIQKKVKLLLRRVWQSVANCRETEKKLIQEFDKRFICRKDIGREYYEGEIIDMIDVFYNVAKKYIFSKTHEHNVNEYEAITSDDNISDDNMSDDNMSDDSISDNDSVSDDVDSDGSVGDDEDIINKFLTCDNKNDVSEKNILQKVTLLKKR